MLEVLDLIADKGGNPEKVRESQRRRYAPEAVVDEVIELYQEARRSEPMLVPISTPSLHDAQSDMTPAKSTQSQTQYKRRLDS